MAGGAGAQPGFPTIPVWAYPGAHGSDGPDSILTRPRTVTLRWKRDRRAEARPDFGGYRIYRAISSPDTGDMVLLRRFSRQTGDEILWHFSILDTTTMQYMKDDQVANDSIIQFVDPDSLGHFEKVCRLVDKFGRCISRGDSVWKLIAPAGPHDGYAVYYSITYEGRNIGGNDYQDLFVPDTLADPGLTQAERYARCDTVGRPTSCPNKNHRATNMTSPAVYPTGGPTSNLERVAVVPNPYRRTEPWDQPGSHELHFINLPSKARIRIFTLAGDLVAEIHHEDAVLDFARWDLKNADGRDVASGIYIYRVEAGSLTFQNRFVVVR